MEHIEIEKQIHAIRKSLMTELKKANAIDNNGVATNRAEFNKIMDNAIAQIQKMEPMVADESGVARDRYASNIYNHQMQILNEMKEKGKTNLDNDSYSLQIGEKNEQEMLNTHNKAPIFKRGANLIKKLQMHFKKKQMENNSQQDIR